MGTRENKGRCAARTLAGLGACMLLLGLGPASALGAPPDPLSFETTNGSVFAVAPGSGVTYVGGSFTGVQAHAERAVRVSTSTGRRNAPSPAVNGQVRATAPDGAGGAYIGGIFTLVGGVARTNVAHVLANGTVDPAWNPGASGGFATPSVNALAVADGAVYIGGAFDTIGGEERESLAKVSATTGNVFTTWDPSPSSPVNALAVSGSALYVGGDFSAVGSNQRFGVAKISTTSGNVFSWAPNPTGGSHGINSVAVAGEAVYFGGGFDLLEYDPSIPAADNVSRSRIAKVSATTGNVFSFNAGTVTGPGSTNPSVDAIVVLGSEVFAGGAIAAIGGQTRSGIAKLSATSGDAFASWNATANQQVVRSLATDGSAVYVAGDFTVIGGQQRPRVAKLSPASALAFQSFNPNPNSTVHSLALSGSNLHLGGAFTAVNTVARNFIAAHDANGAPTDWNPDADQPVFALAASGSDVYAGGAFTEIGGLARNAIAKLSAASGNAFSGWDPDAGAGSVSAVEVSGTDVYVGGFFSNVGGQPRSNIAKLSATSGNAFSGFDPDANDEVREVQVSGSDVYAGGDFTDIGGEPRDNLAKLSATSGNAFSGFDPGNVDGAVNAVVPSGSDLFVGGGFENIGGLARNHIAKLSTASGNAFSGWNPNANDDVHALAVDGSEVFAGGRFTQIGATPVTRNRLAKLSATSGNAFSAFDPNMSNEVEALAVSGGTLHVGGEFLTVGGNASRGYAWFRNP